MADVFSKEVRSSIMSRIRSSGSRPELALQELVRELSGLPVLLNVKDLPGSPDAVVPSIRLAVFMDGCYFHACPLHGRVPKSNVEFWTKKFENNVRRDRRVRSALRADGWTVWVVWEHDLRSKAVVRTRRNMVRRFRRLLGL